MKAIQSTAGAMLATVILLGCASPAMAERGGNRQKLDIDGDGYVTPEEFSESKLSEKAEFSSIDADGDNLLTEDEIRSYVRENMRDRGRRRNQ